jgi:hypothetical protein
MVFGFPVVSRFGRRFISSALVVAKENPATDVATGCDVVVVVLVA